MSQEQQISDQELNRIRDINPDKYTHVYADSNADLHPYPNA